MLRNLCWKHCSICFYETRKVTIQKDQRVDKRMFVRPSCFSYWRKSQLQPLVYANLRIHNTHVSVSCILWCWRYAGMNTGGFSSLLKCTNICWLCDVHPFLAWYTRDMMSWWSCKYHWMLPGICLLGDVRPVTKIKKHWHLQDHHNTLFISYAHRTKYIIENPHMLEILAHSDGEESELSRISMSPTPETAACWNFAHMCAG